LNFNEYGMGLSPFSPPKVRSIQAATTLTQGEYGDRTGALPLLGVCAGQPGYTHFSGKSIDSKQYVRRRSVGTMEFDHPTATRAHQCKDFAWARPRKRIDSLRKISCKGCTTFSYGTYHAKLLQCQILYLVNNNRRKMCSIKTSHRFDSKQPFTMTHEIVKVDAALAANLLLKSQGPRFSALS
jgi:hypothetical protein